MNLFGGIYDNRLLAKIVDSNKKYSMQEQINENGKGLSKGYTDLDEMWEDLEKED